MTMTEGGSTSSYSTLLILREIMKAIVKMEEGQSESENVDCPLIVLQYQFLLDHPQISRQTKPNVSLKMERSRLRGSLVITLII